MKKIETKMRTIFFSDHGPILGINYEYKLVKQDDFNVKELTGIFLTLHVGYMHEIRFKTIDYENDFNIFS